MRSLFDLSYAQAMLVQFSFFSAYFFFALPLGFLVDHIGYRYGIVLGLIVAAIGCALFAPASLINSYALFLLALFVLAIGVCCLQVAANPYVVKSAPHGEGSRTLNLMQGFNSLGTTLAPYFASLVIFSGASVGLSAAEVRNPYLVIAAVLLLLSLVFLAFTNGERRDAGYNEKVFGLAQFFSHVDISGVGRELVQNRSLRLGALGIFFYVGVEVAVGSLLVNFIASPSVGDMSDAAASQYVTLFWLAAMLGRFAGFLLMHYIRPASLLYVNTLVACCLLFIASLANGKVAMWAILALGWCNSIMFPTIFSLTIQRVKNFASQGSGILCMAIVGGALIPLLQGVVADQVGIQLSLLLPILGYLYIGYFAVRYGALRAVNEQ